MSSRINAVNLWASATAVASTGSITSPVIDMRESLGDAVALVLVAAGTAISVDVTLKASLDGQTFFEPFDSSGSLGEVASTITASRWYQFVPPLAPFIQITVAGDVSNGADTTVSGKLIRQTDN